MEVMGAFFGEVIVVTLEVVVVHPGAPTMGFIPNPVFDFFQTDASIAASVLSIDGYGCVGGDTVFDIRDDFTVGITDGFHDFWWGAINIEGFVMIHSVAEAVFCFDIESVVALFVEGKGVG